MKLINLIGYLLISLPFLVILGLAIKEVGILYALSVLATTLLIMGAIILGAFLVDK